MSLAFRCERCGKVFKAGDEWAGRRCKCKQCGHVFVIPGGRSAGESRPAREGAEARGARSSTTQTSSGNSAREFDPYAFNDETWEKQAPSREPELEESLPQRPIPVKPPKKRKRRRAGSGSGDSTDFPYWVFLVGALLGGLLTQPFWAYRPADLNPVWIALIFASFALTSSGVLAGWVIAFREGVSHFLCCFFVPFYSLYYVLSRWDSMKEAFGIAMVGPMLFFLVAFCKPRLAEQLQTNLKLENAAARQARQFGRHPSRVPAFGIPLPPMHSQDSPSPAPAATPRVILADFTDQALADLKSTTLNDQIGALHRLRDTPPNDRRAEVATAVEPLLSASDEFLRLSAAYVLENWGGPENVPALINGLKDPAFPVSWAVLDALKARRDPTSADALVDYMMNSKSRSKVVDALKAIGPEAEDAVLRGLSHPDVLTRSDTCKILKEIGTGKSVTPLRRLASRGDGFGLDVMAADDALKQIQSRNGR